MRTVLAGVIAVVIAGSGANAEPGGNRNADKPQAGKHSHPANAKGADASKRGNGQKGAASDDTQAFSPAKNEMRGNDSRAAKGNPDKVSAKGQQKQASSGNPKNQPAVRAAEREEANDRRIDRILVSDKKGPFRKSDLRNHGLINGCPPGLAKKNNGCTPPGLAKKDPWQPLLGRSDWWGYRDWRDGVRYYDGYLLRYNGSRVASYLPLLGGALSLGSIWPDYYEPVPLPGYYQDFYGLGPSYRYADNVFYRVDPETAVIGSIAALLTGDDIVVGQPLPAYYDIYNVPYRYRDRYVDGTDAIYRYSDGYVYRVDPKTRLVQAALELLL